jgi:hypothetical protein
MRTHSVQSGKSVIQDHEIMLQFQAVDPSSTHADFVCNFKGGDITIV